MEHLPARRKGGFHSYYSESKGRSNQSFELAGCRGEIRGARGYLILHGDAAQRLAGVNFDAAGDAGHFPENLWEAGGVALPTMETRAYTPSAEGAATWSNRAGAALRGLGKVYPGTRNNSLFDAVRFYAYGQHDRGDPTYAR